MPQVLALELNGNPSTYLRPTGAWRQYFLLAETGRRGRTFGKFILSSLQPGTRVGTQVRRRLYVCADRRHSAAAKIRRPADLFLPAVFRFPGHGPSPRRRPQHRRLEHDPRPRRLRPGTQPGGLGKPARHCRLAAVGRCREPPSASRQWRVLRVLMGVGGPGYAFIPTPEGGPSKLRLGGELCHRWRRCQQCLTFSIPAGCFQAAFPTKREPSTSFSFPL